METVQWKALIHKGAECIGIYSRQNAALNHCFQKKAGAKWSKTNKGWYIPCTEKNYELLAKILKGIAILEVIELKKYLLEKKNKKIVAPIPAANKTETKPETEKTHAIQLKPLPQSSFIHRLSKENVEALQKFNQQLLLKSYSSSTIKTYSNEFMQFLQLIKDISAH